MSYHSVSETSKPVPNALPTHAAVDLTKGADQARIVLGDQTYILRITRAGKLILTK
ncbi:hemin uptake protein HemP [Pelagimonas varians]|uniref:Hemin uptake protein hemP n=1 Tax=Pelagimonas varians TaxID=696760 RepID=A0A238L2A9_9RHOB|nr:hemin uptake protein HemP [Pelagimonas varians]PYG26738.1 hemin uptake protein HemP [Pelagimonas varians]SMX49225.1 Hemin uptake protein hemP [Pelagimonas varians]